MARQLRDDPPPPVQSSGITYLGSEAREPVGRALDLAMADKFENDRHIRVKVNSFDLEDRLEELKKILTEEDGKYDVVTIDIVWLRELSNRLVDLTTFFARYVRDTYDDEIISADTVDSKLLAIPWFEDIGLLFYDTKLC